MKLRVEGVGGEVVSILRKCGFMWARSYLGFRVVPPLKQGLGIMGQDIEMSGGGYIVKS